MKSDTASERAARRRLRLLVLLHTGPRTTDNLIAILDKERLFSDEAKDGPAHEKQRLYQFRRDIQALRALGCQVIFDKQRKEYTWQNSPFGLSLNQEQLTALATLFNTFDQSAILHADEIRALLTSLVSRLPLEQQKMVESLRNPFSIDLHETTDYRNADQETVKKIERAIRQRQQLAFRYRSPKHGKELNHVVEPEPLKYEHGHVYLYGWSLRRESRLQFRLDYIVPGSAEVLPTRIATSRPKPVAYRLKYKLHAVIARNSVSKHFENQEVTHAGDGSATITATITDLFEARRILIGYADHCEILEPPELVEIFRAISLNLYNMYHTPKE
ncbi:MAG TPA: WYL domain-containing protein [Ktedonobacteraceae bacterium]|nr:WYL domain-containing protein [Ktedonobacteraceae bacterium]